MGIAKRTSPGELLAYTARTLFYHHAEGRFRKGFQLPDETLLKNPSFETQKDATQEVFISYS
jgi:hypothetical protein